MMPSQGPPAAFHLLAKLAGAICNLDCKYCFFLSKEMLYPGSRFRMADELLELYIRQLIEAHSRVPEGTIAWQGGEPTLMGLDFFRRSVELAEKYKGDGQRIAHTIQTNGTQIDDDWAAFFKEHNFLVGLSVDGPREIHDTYRVNKGGAGSFDQVMRGWHYLKAYGVDVNILCTVHAANQDRPLEVYRFFRDELKTEFIQFIPIVERVILPKPGRKSDTRRKHERKRWFRRGRCFHAGVEGRISVIKRKYGLGRCRNRGRAGFECWVGWGIIANNLTMMGRGLSP